MIDALHRLRPGCTHIRIKNPKQEDEELSMFRMEGYDTRNDKAIELICKDVATANKLYPHVKDIRIKEIVQRRE